MLRKNITDEKKWDEAVEEALFAYRTAKHASTGYSPFYLMYNRQASQKTYFKRMKLDIVFNTCYPLVMHNVTCKLFFNYREPVLPTDVTEGAEPETNDDVQTVEDDEGRAVELMSRVRERVLKNIEEAQQRQKKHYDRRAGATEVIDRLDFIKIIACTSQIQTVSLHDWLVLFRTYVSVINHIFFRHCLLVVPF